MKKYIILIAIWLLLVPATVFAKDGTKKMYINIKIREDGSLDMEEVAELSGEYNGRLRNIEYQNTATRTFSGAYEDFKGSSIYNGSALTNLKVCETSSVMGKNGIGKCEKEYQRVSSGTNGMSGVYEETTTVSGVDLKIYNPSERKKAFYLSYTIKDAVVVHDDVAELAWNILGSDYKEDIEELKVWVHLPANDPDYRVFLKGSANTLNGEVEKLTDQTAYIDYHFLGANNPITVRLMFRKDMVPLATKQSRVMGRENILKVEKEAADEANRIRTKIKNQNRAVIGITILWYFLSLFAIIYFIISKKKNKKVDFYQDYYRDFPGTYGPEILEYLLKKNIGEKSFSASILNIIDKKVLRLEREENKKEDILVLTDQEMTSLTENEKLLCRLLIQKIGDGKKVSLSAIKQYGKEETKARIMIKEYNLWQKQATKEAEAKNFFTGIHKSQTMVLLIGMASILIAFFNAYFETNFPLGYCAVLFGLGEAFYAMWYSFKTKTGALEYEKWQAFKRFLKDFGLLDEKELPEIKLWGKYLVYALVLGCADEVEKAMKIRLDAMNIDEASPLYWDYYYTDYLIRDNLYASISNSMTTAVSTSRSSIAASNMSSSSGTGGGSSFGGGSFGGGGGGGRF